jgi:hypothetical protein
VSERELRERELRERLHAEVAAVGLPAGLVDGVRRGARRRRRIRLGAAAALVVAVAVAGAGAVAYVPEPVPVAGRGLSDACVELPAVPPPAAVPDTVPSPAGWAYRGDPALAPGIGVPLLGVRSGARVIRAAAQRRASGWVAVLGAGGSEVSVPLPAGTPGAQVSAYVDGTLVVVAAEGTTQIDYAGCRDGEVFRRQATGGFLVAALSGLRTSGRLATWAGGRMDLLGRPGDVTGVPLALAAEPAPPAGYRLAESTLVTADSSRPDPGRIALDRAARGSGARPSVVLATCAGAGSVQLRVYGSRTGLRCDGRTVVVWAGRPAWGINGLEVDAVPQGDRPAALVSVRVGLARQVT